MVRVKSWNVQLVPGNQHFRVEGEETVLEAALRAGVSISYGCSNGNCGDCRARILAGEVRKVRPHDYVFSEGEKMANHALMCSVTPVSDLVLQMDVADSPDQIPHQQIGTTVRGMERPHPQLLIVRLQTPRTRRLRFLAGQQVRLTAIDGAPPATHPLANCPCDDRNLMIHLDARADDAFTAHCFGHMRNGDTVQVEGPLGDFVLPDETPRPLLFIAANTGFAPIRSILEHVLAQESPERIDLVWMADETIGHYQDNLCRSWQDAMDNLRYHALPAAANMDGGSAGDALKDVVSGLDDVASRHCFIAGCAPFAMAAREAVHRAGILADRIRMYTPARIG